jgi:hypothetical protein
MSKSWRVLWWAAACLFLLLFVLTGWPAATQRFEIRLTSAEGAPILVSRDAVIEIPSFIWQGETGDVRLIILAQESDPPGSAAVMVETRLEMPVELTSGDMKWEALVPGQQVTFTWGVRGSTPGLVQGKLWVWVKTDNESQALLARPVELNVRTIGGFQPGFVRWSAAVISLVCLLAGFISRKTLE